MRRIAKHVGISIALACCAAAARGERAEGPAERLVDSVPRSAEGFVEPRMSEFMEAAGSVQQWSVGLVWDGQAADARESLRKVEELAAAKEKVDAALEKLLRLRTRLAALPDDQRRRDLIHAYLRAASRMIDLSGRLRDLLQDAIEIASYRDASDSSDLEALMDLLIRREISIGAVVLSYSLFDPPPNAGAAPLPIQLKHKVLQLIEATAQVDLLPVLAQFLADERTPAELVVAGAEVVRRLGLPQDPCPDQGAEAPAPPLTGEQLGTLLSQLEIPPGDASLSKRRAELLEWLDERKRGIRGDRFRFGRLEVRAGDWLLMRNPSPYNLFTDLSPGLFTHVGVVAVKEGADGVRRFVIVDLPEQGRRVPATNVDVYLQRTLHYFFLRHEDAEAGRKMGEAARSLIGNETQFDLTFRTDRVLALKGKPLEGARINTYCAGLLLLVAQAADVPREEMFPIVERPAPGRCMSNLAKLGISIGRDFVSPTGALFSPRLRISGRREPMYSPGRDVAEAVYDHFAWCMIHRVLRPSPTAYQAVRQKLAELSKGNSLLAEALARVNNVSADMDLASAAKAAAVVETLDDIANGGSTDLFYARNAILAGPPEQLHAQGLDEARIEQIRKYRRRHEDLVRQWEANQLTPQQLLEALVEDYKDRGRKQLEDRFFPEAE